MYTYPITLKPIGVVRHNYSDDYVRNSLTGVDGVIEVFYEYRAGLRGLDGFSHIIILAYLHKVEEAKRKVLVVKPRGLGRRLGVPQDYLPDVGVFATDSPHRPNPIALSIVRLKGIDTDSGLLIVEGLDLFSGTPVLDIKPYTPERRVEGVRIPKWLEDLLSLAKQHTQRVE